MNQDITAKNAGWYLRVTDLKQFAYCPRVVYYSYCLPLVRPTTYKMEASLEMHDKAASDEARRSLRAYGLSEGERRYDVTLVSERLGLSGRMDMVIVLGKQEAIPVDYKLSRHGEARHFHQQLAAYAELIEENWQIAVRRGFLYLLPERRAEEVKLTSRLRVGLRGQVVQMRQMIASQAMPEPTTAKARCINCEFRRFCNDLF